MDTRTAHGAEHCAGAPQPENEVVTDRDRALHHLSLGDSLVTSCLHALAQLSERWTQATLIVDPKKRIQVAEMRSGSLRHIPHGLFLGDVCNARRGDRCSVHCSLSAQALGSEESPSLSHGAYALQILMEGRKGCHLDLSTTMAIKPSPSCCWPAEWGWWLKSNRGTWSGWKV